jgi:hypothetical protein
VPLSPAQDDGIRIHLVGIPRGWHGPLSRWRNEIGSECSCMERGWKLA